MEPFRFVHAARLMLDHQLQGTGPIPATLRAIVRDATIDAWEKVVDLCLSEQVDLLLLTGESIDPREQSLRGPAALIRGLERLSERDIPVVIAAGTGDPWDTWPGGFRFPANVVRLGVDVADELPITRNGRLLAHLRGDRDYFPPESTEAPWLLKLPAGREQPFSICVSPGPHRQDRELTEPDAFAAYRATGGGAIPRTIVESGCCMHDPGPTQAIRPIESGPRGCTLISVDETGQMDRRFVSTAPVRFEQLGLSVTPEHTRDDLLLDMIGAVERLPRHSSDRVWLLAWNVHGSGSWVDRLASEDVRAELLGSLAQEAMIPNVAIFSHAMRIIPQVPMHTEEFHADVDSDDELLSNFRSRLARRAAGSHGVLERCLDDSPIHGGPWELSLSALIAELEPADVAHEIQRKSPSWFTTHEEKAS